MPVLIRDAVRADVPSLVALLSDDPLGETREAAPAEDLSAYFRAFDALAADPNNDLVVMEDMSGIVGTLQITYTPGLSRRGVWRATVEGVRVSRRARGRGLGRVLMQEAIVRARSRGCRLVQLTTDLTRHDARRFYESLGFEATHAGMKLSLET